MRERYRSPGRYVGDALQIAAIFRRQIRRTTDVQLLPIESCGLYICFLSATLFLAPEAASDPTALVRVLIPAAIMQLPFVLATGYAPPLSRHAAFANATVAAQCAFLSVRRNENVRPAYLRPKPRLKEETPQEPLRVVQTERAARGSTTGAATQQAQANRRRIPQRRRGTAERWALAFAAFFPVAIGAPQIASQKGRSSL